MWVKWVHAFYVKARNLAQLQLPKQTIWVVKKVFDARSWWNPQDNWREFLDTFARSDRFNIKKVYNSLIPSSLKYNGNNL